MLFTSGTFLLVFLPITLIAFFGIARTAGLRSAIVWLTLASLFFYAYWDARFVALLVGSIAFNYLIGELLYRARSSTPAKRKSILFLGIGTDLALLAYFKYADFFVDNFNTLAHAHLPAPHIVLPLGISFFTFTQIAYLADVYAGKVTERSPWRYALFVTYFPHLIAGPVLHHAEMMPQFADPAIARARMINFVLGLSFLILGIAKKVLLADSVAPFANEAFTHVNTELIPTWQAWQGALAYTLQIYFDFSGYSDMAVGLSLLIGVRLPYNFNSPYKARNIVDFWRRWHMTLSRFLRDYLYIPLGGNKKGTVRRYANLFTTMLLGGLWHGAAWTFVLWGALHGSYLMCNHAWQWCKQHLDWVRRLTTNRTARYVGPTFSWVLTLFAVVVGWVYFRAESVSAAHRMLSCMAALCTLEGPAPIVEPAWFVLIPMAALALFAPNSQELVDAYQKRLNARGVKRKWMKLQPTGIFVGAVSAVTLLIAMISASRLVTEFIYFNF